MRARTIILILLVIVLGAGTVFLINTWLNQQEAALRAQRDDSQPAQQEARSAKILVAARGLPSGHFLRPEDVRWQDWPTDNVPGSYLRKDAFDPQQLIGAVVRQGVGEGQPITPTMMVRPGDHGFLAAVLWPGTRAVSVPVNAASAVSGLVFPGDRVDIILTRSLRVRGNGTNHTRQSSETILQNVRIIAIDQSTNDQQQNARIPDTVTLELTPNQAEIVMLAQQMGRLSLSLRSLAPESERDMARQVSESQNAHERSAAQVLRVGQRDGQEQAGSPDTHSDPARNGRPTPRHELGQRGTSITRDYQVSRMGTGDGNQRGKTVIVVRGSRAQRLVMRGGNLDTDSNERGDDNDETEAENDE